MAGATAASYQVEQVMLYCTGDKVEPDTTLHTRVAYAHLSSIHTQHNRLTYATVYCTCHTFAFILTCIEGWSSICYHILLSLGCRIRVTHDWLRTSLQSMYQLSCHALKLCNEPQPLQIQVRGSRYLYCGSECFP